MPTFIIRPGATPALAFRLHDVQFASATSAGPELVGAIPAAPVVAAGLRKVVLWGVKRGLPLLGVRKWLERGVKEAFKGHSGEPEKPPDIFVQQRLREAVYGFTELGLMIAFGAPVWFADPPPAAQAVES